MNLILTCEVPSPSKGIFMPLFLVATYDISLRVLHCAPEENYQSDRNGRSSLFYFKGFSKNAFTLCSLRRH